MPATIFLFYWNWQSQPRSRLPPWHLGKADWQVYAELAPKRSLADFDSSDVAATYFTDI